MKVCINRVVTIVGGNNQKGFREIKFGDMLSKPNSGFQRIDYAKMKKDAPISEQ